MSFLKAEWRKLIMVNYEVDPKLLQPYVPAGTSIDLWNEKCYLSVVGFMFLNTRVLRVRIPFHVNFEEVNLRFYVKRKDGNEVKRGVVFIKELVSKRAITFIANSVYHENYETLPMRHEWHMTEDAMNISYGWRKSGRWNTMQVKAKPTQLPIVENSKTEFISEHYWGYAKRRHQKTNEYEVLHPRWNRYEVEEHAVDIDFERTYGSQFAFLNMATPDSVMLLEGSEIAVERKRRV